MIIFLKKLQCFSVWVSQFCLTHTALCLSFLLALSLVLKLLTLWLDPVIGRDASLYCHMAQTWYEQGYDGIIKARFGNGWIPPLIPFLMTCGMSCGLSAVAAGLIINVCCGVLCVLCGYGIAWETTQNKKIALIAAAFFAVHPGINALSVEIQRDALYLLLAGSVIWCVAAGLNRKNLLVWCAGGACCGIALLTRYETFELLPIVGAVLVIAAVCRKISWKRAILCCCIFFLFSVTVFLGTVWGMGTIQIIERYQKYFSGKIAGVQVQFSDSEKERK